MLVLRAGVLPWLLRRGAGRRPADARETRPLVNVAASLLAAAGLTLLAYAGARPLVALAPVAGDPRRPGRRSPWC